MIGNTKVIQETYLYRVRILKCVYVYVCKYMLSWLRA